MRRRLLYHETAVEPTPTIWGYEIVIDEFYYAEAGPHDVALSPIYRYHYHPIYNDQSTGDDVYITQNDENPDFLNVEFSIDSSSAAAVADAGTEVDKNNGNLTFNAWEEVQTEDSDRLLATVNMEVWHVASNGATRGKDERSTNAVQAAIQIKWHTPVVTLSYDDAPAQPEEEGGEIILKPTVKWTQEGYDDDGNTHTETSDEVTNAQYVFSSTGDITVDVDGNVTVPSSTVEEKHNVGNVTVGVTNEYVSEGEQTGYANCDIYQEAYIPEQEETSNLMDVVFYNKNNGKLCIMNRLKEDYTNYPRATYTPIGIVIAECDNDISTYGQNGYNANQKDGFQPQTIGIMALNNVQSGTLMWGGVDAISWIMLSRGESVTNRAYTIPLCDITNDVGDSKYNDEWASDLLERITPGIIGIPSDMFTDIKSADADACYKDGYEAYSLSPYTSGLFYYNTEYWKEIYEGGSDFTYYSCFSDFSGEEKSQVYLHRMTDAGDMIEGNDTNWMDKESIVSNQYMLPAMEACYKYYTDGTGQGTWYLPAAGELGHIVARASAIDNTLDDLASIYGVSVTKLSSASNNPYLASTIGFFTDANSHVVVYPGNAGVSLQWNIGDGDVIGTGYARPFKRMEVYYRDSEGYFHDEDRTEKEWYDQIPTAYDDDYAQHIGIYRTADTSGSSNYPTGAVSGIVYGILVKSESDLTVVRTDVPLFTIENLGAGSNTVVTFDQKPQCGWYIPQYVAVNNSTSALFINSSVISIGDVVPKSAWEGNISVINRYSESIDGIGTSNGDSGYYADEIPVFKAGDWNFNIGIFMHPIKT